MQFFKLSKRIRIRLKAAMYKGMMAMTTTLPPLLLPEKNPNRTRAHILDPTREVVPLLNFIIKYLNSGTQD